MIVYLNSRIHIYYLLFFSILNILDTEEKYQFFNITISKNEDGLGKLYINNSQLFQNINENDIDDNNCIYWIPSLFNPLLFGHSKLDINDYDEYKEGKNIQIKAPIISLDQEISMTFCIYPLFGKYDLILGKEILTKIVDDCYFGLSFGFENNNNFFSDNETNLNKLLNYNKIDKKILSFDKWSITDSLIKTTLYLGDLHDNFIPNNKGIIGECKVIQNVSFWGCEFKEISFNGKKTQLIKDEEKNEFYKIYFSSENHNITFPKLFRNKFDDITNNVCKGGISEEISCDNLFNSEDFFPLKLIDDNMIITIEIDNKLRYNNIKKDNEYKTRIKFENIDYFILPLIVFKNFDIQFNAQDNIISFYTTDESILELKKKNDSNPVPKEEEEPSNAGIIILVIFIVLLILVLLFGIFWFLKKRRKTVEINKYNKFEDEENFQDMNDKKVF